MRAWRASPQLVRLLRAVEADLRSYGAQAGRRPEGPYAEVLPFAASQLQDWQSYAAAGQTSTSQVSVPLLTQYDSAGEAYPHE